MLSSGGQTGMLGSGGQSGMLGSGGQSGMFGSAEETAMLLIASAEIPECEGSILPSSFYG